MLMLRLWRSLQTPYAAHPLYRYTERAPVAHRSGLMDLLTDSSLWGIVSFLVIVLLLIVGSWRALVLLLLVGPLIVLVTPTFAGLLVMLRTSRLISDQAAGGRSPLLGVTPLGLPGMLWALASSAFHRHVLFERVRTASIDIYLFCITLLAIPATIAGTIGIVNLFLFPDVSLFDYRAWVGIINWAAVIGCLFTDLIGSILVGLVLGMLAPVVVPRLTDAQGLAIGLFLAIQFITYATFLLLAFTLLPALTSALAIDLPLLSLLRVLALLLLREMTMQVLWRGLVQRTESSPAEFRTIIGG